MYEQSKNGDLLLSLTKVNAYYNFEFLVFCCQEGGGGESRLASRFALFTSRFEPIIFAHMVYVIMHANDPFICNRFKAT